MMLYLVGISHSCQHYTVVGGCVFVMKSKTKEYISTLLFFATTSLYAVKPDELVQLKPFEETNCLKSFKFINSNNLSIKKYLICFQVTQ